MNLVEWLKTMVTNRNAEGVLDPRLQEKPCSRALKRALLVALRCVDPNAHKRPKMGHVIHMLEAEEFPFRDVSFGRVIGILFFLKALLYSTLVMQLYLLKNFLLHVSLFLH